MLMIDRRAEMSEFRLRSSKVMLFLTALVPPYLPRLPADPARKPAGTNIAYARRGVAVNQENRAGRRPRPDEMLMR